MNYYDDSPPPLPDNLPIEMAQRREIQFKDWFWLLLEKDDLRYWTRVQCSSNAQEGICKYMTGPDERYAVIGTVAGVWCDMPLVGEDNAEKTMDIRKAGDEPGPDQYVVDGAALGLTKENIRHWPEWLLCELGNGLALGRTDTLEPEKCALYEQPESGILVHVEVGG